VLSAFYKTANDKEAKTYNAFFILGGQAHNSSAWPAFFR
jgi:hypothetical protein